MVLSTSYNANHPSNFCYLILHLAQCCASGAEPLFATTPSLKKAMGSGVIVPLIPKIVGLCSFPKDSPDPCNRVRHYTRTEAGIIPVLSALRREGSTKSQPAHLLGPG